MSVQKKRCRVCREWFMPDARTARFQKTCPAASCRQERKRQADRLWRANNADYEASRQGKKRAWAQSYPDYWRQYRATHPGYVECNRAKTRERQKASRRVFANQDAIRRDPVGYLEDLRAVGMFANQDAIARPIDGILTFLVRREGFANHDAIGHAAPMADNRVHERATVGGYQAALWGRKSTGIGNRPAAAGGPQNGAPSDCRRTLAGHGSPSAPETALVTLYGIHHGAA